MTSTRPPRVLVVGLGLIGASLAKGLRLSRSAHVLGMDAAEGVADRALELGIIDERVVSADSVPAFDVLVLAVPVLAMKPVLTRLKPHLRPDTVITDVGSVKGVVVDAAREALGGLPAGFVPGHPIAGAERSGVEAARADLFVRHLLILTPLPTSSADATATLTRLWRSVGAEVVTMPVARHDEVLAATSHLPHLVAFSLVDTLARESDNREIFRYAAGGFRDFTRIAASDPTMWHDVFLANAPATLSILRRFQDDLDLLATAIEQRDSDTLLDVFGRAKSARDHFTKILESRQQHSPATRKSLIAAPLQHGLSGAVDLPVDCSPGVFHITAATLVPGSDVRLTGSVATASLNGFLDTLIDMGGRVEVLNKDSSGGEPLVDLRVRYAPLGAGGPPIRLDGLRAEELPALFVLATQAAGVSRLVGVRALDEARARRLEIMVEGLGALGADIELKDDEVTIGGRSGRPLDGGIVDCAGDHRVALAFVVAAQVARRPVIIRNSGRVTSAYPGFVEHVDRLGYSVTAED